MPVEDRFRLPTCTGQSSTGRSRTQYYSLSFLHASIPILHWRGRIPQQIFSFAVAVVVVVVAFAALASSPLDSLVASPTRPRPSAEEAQSGSPLVHQPTGSESMLANEGEAASSTPVGERVRHRRCSARAQCSLVSFSTLALSRTRTCLVLHRRGGMRPMKPLYYFEIAFRSQWARRATKYT